MKKKFASLAWSILFVSIVLLFNAILIKIDITSNHFDVITEDMTEQNEQTIVDNISSNNDYYLNTIGYVIGDNNHYLINQSTKDGKKLLPIHLTDEQKKLVSKRNTDDIYHVCIIAKVIDDDYNVEFIDACTDKELVDSNRIVMHRFIIGGICMLMLAICAFAFKEDNNETRNN